MRRVASALAVLLGAVACDPAPPDPLAELHAAGRAALEAGDGERAEELYGRLLAAKPEWPDAAYELGAYFAGNGYPKRAEPLLRRAVDLAPKDPRAPLALGQLLLRGAQVEGALPQLEEAVRRAGEGPLAVEAAEARDRARRLLGLEPG